MQCKTVKKQFDRFLRQELTPKEQAAIESHVEQCEACRQCLIREKRLTTILENTLEPPKLPEGFGHRLIEAARQHQAEYVVTSDHDASEQSWHRENGRRASASLSVRFAQAAVLAAGILLGLLMGQQTWQSMHLPSASLTSQNHSQTAYRLDCLSDAPDGSLAESFLTLTASSNPRER